MALHVEREQEVKTLRAAVLREIETGIPVLSGELEELIWKMLKLFQDEVFHTAKGLEFTYHIRGNEMFVSRKDKSITRATVSVAAGTAMAIRRSGREVTGPKKLGTFGASYLYPVFIRIGVIPADEIFRQSELDIAP